MTDDDLGWTRSVEGYIQNIEVSDKEQFFSYRMVKIH